MNKPEMILFSSDARGVYIPKHFADDIKRDCVTGVEADDWEILSAGPDHDLYWDVWTGVCDSAVVTSDTGIKYRLHQDGDLWLIPEGMSWNEERDCWYWPEEDEQAIGDSYHD